MRTMHLITQVSGGYMGPNTGPKGTKNVVVYRLHKLDVSTKWLMRTASKDSGIPSRFHGKLRTGTFTTTANLSTHRSVVLANKLALLVPSRVEFCDVCWWTAPREAEKAKK